MNARISRPGLTLAVHAAVVLAAIALIWTNIRFDLDREYNRAMTGAIAESGDLALVFEAMTAQTIDSIDRTLLVTRELYARDPQGFNLASWARNPAFLNGLNIQLAVADTAGRLVQSNLGPVSGVSIADREHFAVHTRTASDELFISRPVMGRVSGKLSIQFTRPVRDLSGLLIGVVVASLDPLAIGAIYRSVEIGHGEIVLAGLDGATRATRAEVAGKDLPPPPPRLLEEAAYAAVGHYQAWIPGAGEAIVSFRRVGTRPLVVAVGLELRRVLAGYVAMRRQHLIIGAGLTVVVLALGLAALMNRRKLARSRTSLTVTLENMSQGILMVDRDGRIPVINRRAVDLLGVPPELARENADFTALIRWQANQGEFTGADRVATLVGAGGLDASLPVYQRTRPNGTVLEVRTALLDDGAAVRTFTDITERERVAAELVAARDKAQAAERAQAAFLMMMSHEVRTPLNGILGLSDLLIDGRAPAEEAQGYLKLIGDSGRHLLLLIDDILDYSRLDSGRLKLEATVFDLPDLVANTVSMIRPAATAKGLAMGVSVGDGVPARVIGDPDRLRQVLANLIGNAVKFTEAGAVTVTVDHAAAGRVAFTVRDTGIGIPPEALPTLFDAFTQADGSTTRRFGGTGLGLAICSRLVSLMGGSIAADSTPGAGSAFRFEIALPQAPAPAPPPAARVPRLRILLAEDNATNRLVATRMLARLGHEVDAVPDGAQAVEAACRSTYDLVLMDMMMPVMDGLAATRAIRAAGGALAGIRIVGLTANARPADEAACRDAGMDGFLTKPVTLERLAHAIAAVSLPASPPTPALESQS